MYEDDWATLRIFLFILLGLIIGFGCKSFVCSDRNYVMDSLENIEDELDMIQTQQRSLSRNIENCQHVIATPVQDEV